MVRKREAEPNYQLLLKSYVCSINMALSELAKEQDKHNKLCGINEDGTPWIYEGYKERTEKIEELKIKINRLFSEMQDIKAKMEG